MVNVRKRGNVYEYNFDVAKIEGKRKRITKSGFKTKAETLKKGTIAYLEMMMYLPVHLSQVVLQE